MTRTYTHVILFPNGSRYTNILPKAPDYELLRRSVGGSIQTVPEFKKFEGHTRVTAYCHEEGLINGLPFNQQATDAWKANFPPEAKLWYEPTLVGPVSIHWKNP